MSGAGEMNFDGIVGPTHNYAGLSVDNVASVASRRMRSNPRAAALEGLLKMRVLVELGVSQAVLPPHERPHTPTLRRLGFSGSDGTVIAGAGRAAPHLLAACASASAMWAANAATVTPSSDTRDGRVHLTPANLVTHAHRSIEAATTLRVLRSVFADESAFAVHAPLPPSAAFSDEGAANHMRFGRPDGPGVHLFVHGSTARGAPASRQHRQASAAIARLHGIPDDRVLFAEQHPEAIAAGAFHNDVVAVANDDVLLCHETSFVDQPALLRSLGDVVERVTGRPLRVCVVPAVRVSLPDAIASYLFNAQLVESSAGACTLVVPSESREVASVASWLEAAAGDAAHPIERIVTVSVRQSMRNGGGPACLRLRVPLSGGQSPHPGVVVDPQLLTTLEGWVSRHYRDRLEPDDLADPALHRESHIALDELTQI